jgi:hypothetical protein
MIAESIFLQSTYVIGSTCAFINDSLFLPGFEQGWNIHLPDSSIKLRSRFQIDAISIEELDLLFVFLFIIFNQLSPCQIQNSNVRTSLLAGMVERGRASREDVGDAELGPSVY